MAAIRVDTSGLTYTKFLIPGQMPAFLDGATVPTVSLAPGTYHIQQRSGQPAKFRFTVTAVGTVDYAAEHDGFLSGRGTATLVIRGFRVRLDATALSHDLLPIMAGATVLGRGAVHELTLAPCDRYVFQPASGIVADFSFDVGTDGRIAVDPRFAGFARVSDRTLTISGYTIAIEGRHLSHALLPLAMLGGTSVLPNDRLNEYTYIPATGYGFQPASGIVADFRFAIDVDGRIVVDPRYSGFVRVDGRLLILDGYTVTIDGRGLSHDLLPLAMLGDIEVLPRSRTNEFTYLPAAGYGFQPAPGVVAGFRFAVDVDGNVVVGQQYTGFTEVHGRTLVLGGHPVVVDGWGMPGHLVPAYFGGTVVPRDRPVELRLLPGTPYLLHRQSASGPPARFAVHTDGTIGTLEVPPGMVVRRPAPPPGTLRALYADLFLPAGGSVRRFRDKGGNFPSLRDAIRRHRDNSAMRQLWFSTIDALFDGGTSEEEEDRALSILLGTERADDLAHLINRLTWDRLDDELDEGDLTQIMDRMKVLLDRRDYYVGFMLRWFYLVDDAHLPNMDFVNVLAPYAASRGVEVRHSFADQVLTQKDLALDHIAGMALRNRPTGVREFTLAVDNAAGPEQYSAVALQRLSAEAFYTERICSELARGEFRLLLQTLADLFNPALPNFPVRNIALFNMLRKFDRFFVAMDRLIAIIGSERQKADARRFMDSRRLLMDNFPANLPPAPAGPFQNALNAAVAAVLAALTGVAGTFQDLVAAVQAIVDAIGNISAGQLLDSVEDDRAVSTTNTMSAEGLLVALPSPYKSKLIDRMLDGACEDEEEDAILVILRETKTRSHAEFCQLGASATWETLDSSFDGSQYDELEGMLTF